jgi:hypothetical protein
MPDDTDAFRFVPDLEPSAVRRIVSTGLALAGLLFLLGLLTVVPGMDRLLEGLAVPPEAVALAAMTAVTVGALLWVAPAVQRVVEGSLDGPAGAVADAAIGAKLLVGFLAVAVAYQGFAPAVTPLFRAFDVGGLYHLGFLVAGLAILAALARRLYRCWEPVTEFLTAAVVDDADGTTHDRVSTE